MIEVHRIISSSVPGQDRRRSSGCERERCRKRTSGEYVRLGLANKICPTVVFAECYRFLSM